MGFRDFGGNAIKLHPIADLGHAAQARHDKSGERFHLILRQAET
jgi:hypothetical protein